MGAWLLVSEVFGWRVFDHRKQLGARVGLSPPLGGGEMSREQGISKSWNPAICCLMVELAWIWLRYQPESKVSVWFHSRFPDGSRQRRIAPRRRPKEKVLSEAWASALEGVD